MNRPAGVRAKGRGSGNCGFVNEKMRSLPGRIFRFSEAGLFLDLFEIALVDAANRACPVVGNLLGRRSGRGGNPADVLYR